MLGDAAARRVREAFSLDANIQGIAARFGLEERARAIACE
jgi:hypothetical protein